MGAENWDVSPDRPSFKCPHCRTGIVFSAEMLREIEREFRAYDSRFDSPAIAVERVAKALSTFATTASPNSRIARPPC